MKQLVGPYRPCKPSLFTAGPCPAPLEGMKLILPRLAIWGALPPTNAKSAKCLVGILSSPLHAGLRGDTVTVHAAPKRKLLRHYRLVLTWWLSGKKLNPPVNAGDTGSIPGSGRSPGGRHGNPPLVFLWEIPMDRGAWQAVVHGVARSWTPLK